MASELGQRGYYSLLRWRRDATRDEARNVAVLLVEAEGQFAGIKAAPVSSVSSRLREQGLLDAMLVALQGQFESEQRPTLALLRELHGSLQRSLYVTEPQPVAVPDPDAVLNALYRAYVAPRGGGSRAITKGAMLDRVVGRLREHGYEVRRGEYVNDFLFDVVIGVRLERPTVAEVFSFANTVKNWAPVEYDAGHFLYALGRSGAEGFSVIQPPSEVSPESAVTTYERVLRWFERAAVPVIEPSELDQGRLPIGARGGA